MKNLLLFALLSVGLLAFGCGDDDLTPSPEKREISLGAIVALDGPISYFGTTAKAAIELAVEDINQELGTEVQLNPILIRNSYGVPDSALSAIEALNADGLNVIIGPQSSGEVARVRSYADAHDIVVISPASIARSQSIAGDNVFRFSPDDTYQAEAMVAMVVDDKLDALITVHRDDTWGHDLVGLVMKQYNDQGGNVYDSLSYDPTSSDFSTLLEELETEVEQAVAQYGAEKVGVYLLSYGEAEEMFSEATDRPVLSRVKWYGGAPTAQSPRLLENSKAATFALATTYPCSTLALEESLRSKWQPLQERIAAATGQVADIYAFVTYDAVQIAVRSWLAASSNDITSFKEKLTETAASYTGMTGPIILNDAGDRATGNYDFWAIKNTGNGLEWERVAFYHSTTKMLTRD
ncbi:MAG: ABC transporter substrate-binding protein [Ignavibacteriae bacterium]|nr:ABC transporter substrate-binding protein [Ignavibacteriota bacterium]MCB9214348.1 ABC transporter substrate-binding protein [Ignavibacteria bacterium]